MTFTELIDNWQPNRLLADDLKVGERAVGQMKARNSIHSEHWVDVVDSARKHGIKGVTFEKLSRMKLESITAAKGKI